MKNVCVVGFGAIGPVHTEAIRKTKNARLYAVCDTDNEKLRTAKEKYDVKTYVDFDLMLKDKKIDAVHICTPHYLHFEMMKKALCAGKEILCEKPVTRTALEFERLLKLNGADMICTALQNRLNPSVEKLKKIIAAGELGKVKTAKGILTWQRAAEYYTKEQWRGKWETEGGGLLINQAIHTLDLLSYLVGDIKTVRAAMNNFSIPEIEVEDTFSAYLGFASGINGVFFATNSYGDNSAPEIEIVFEKGKARYSEYRLFVNGELVEEDEKACGGKAYWGNGHEKLIANYYDNNKFFGLVDVKNTMRTVFAMYESANLDGKPVLIEV